MNCLFCKKDSSGSKSKEHILPESLGNIEHVLPSGIVCDGCNNYFATKVEKVLLEQPYFRSLRHRNDIITKKGNLVPEKGIIANPKGGIIDVFRDKDGLSLDINNPDIIDLIITGKVNKLYLPIGEPEPEKNNATLSRFLAKVSVEALIYWIKNDVEWIVEVTNKAELERIKGYARYGTHCKLWPYHQRRLYEESDRFFNPKIQDTPYEVLHEFKFFWTKEQEFYFVLAIMGIEYAINMGSPSIDTYVNWLRENNNASILNSEDEKIILKD